MAAGIGLWLSVLLVLGSNASALPDQEKGEASEVHQAARYLILHGVRNVVVSDELGHSSDNLDTYWKLNATIMSLGSEVEDVVLGGELDYTITFETSDQVAIDFTVGYREEATKAVRYWDLIDLPEAVKAILHSPKTGIGLEWLRYDADGDGVYESVARPSAEVIGPLAADFIPPTISVSANPQGENLEVTITAEDDLSGVKVIYCSLDGEHSQPYAEPFEVDPTHHPIIYVIADDKVANRTGIHEFRLDEVPQSRQKQTGN